MPLLCPSTSPACERPMPLLCPLPPLPGVVHMRCLGCRWWGSVVGVGLGQFSGQQRLGAHPQCWQHFPCNRVSTPLPSPHPTPASASLPFPASSWVSPLTPGLMKSEAQDRGGTQWGRHKPRTGERPSAQTQCKPQALGGEALSYLPLRDVAPMLPLPHGTLACKPVSCDASGLIPLLGLGSVGILLLGLQLCWQWAPVHGGRATAARVREWRGRGEGSEREGERE